MNKLSIAKNAHKILTILAVISTLSIVGFMLYEGFLYKPKGPQGAGILEDIGDLSTDTFGSITWKQLADTKTQYQTTNSDEKLIPQYSKKLMSLNHKQVSIRGFMFPLDASTKQSHFLLSPYASTCPFCLPAGPAELIDVHPTEPTTVYGRSVVVTGSFELLMEQSDLQGGMFYRINNAEVK